MKYHSESNGAITTRHEGNNQFQIIVHHFKSFFHRPDIHIYILREPSHKNPHAIVKHRTEQEHRLIVLSSFLSTLINIHLENAEPLGFCRTSRSFPASVMAMKAVISLETISRLRIPCACARVCVFTYVCLCDWVGVYMRV